MCFYLILFHNDWGRVWKCENLRLTVMLCVCGCVWFSPRVSPWLLLSLMWTLHPSSSWASTPSPVSLSASSSAWMRDTDGESSVTSHSSAARPRRNTEWFCAGLKVYRSRADSPADDPIRSSWKHGCTPASMAEACDCLPPRNPPPTCPTQRPPLICDRPWVRASYDPFLNKPVLVKKS